MIIIQVANCYKYRSALLPPPDASALLHRSSFFIRESLGRLVFRGGGNYA